ncbi:hypothetical protein KHM19_12960 [Leptospira borgpetersenii]|nr:hypothetical protein KHM09_11750 [Leptospira borgpetersenii]GIM22113.1 hypothetical protein KHM19_12960 [Leptospira borgpetersenii]
MKKERKCAPSKEIAIKTDKKATERPMKVGFISARVPTIIGFYKKILSYQKEQRIVTSVLVGNRQTDTFSSVSEL